MNSRCIRHGGIKRNLDNNIEEMLARRSKIHDESFDFQQKLRMLRYRGTSIISIMLMCTGGSSLVLSYLYSSLILTFIGLGLTLWGAIIAYVLPSRHVPEKIIAPMVLHTIRTLDDLLANIGYKGRTVFYYPRHENGPGQGHVFIPYEKTQVPHNHGKFEGTLHNDSEGISIVAPSQGLVDLFERELKVNFADVDLYYMQENLPRLLIEDLKLVDDLLIESDKDVIRARIVGRSSAEICDSVNKLTKLGSNLG
ncbi:MAG: hypothetical protein ACRD38_03380, partial [Nitrososphaerales archaeon]